MLISVAMATDKAACSYSFFKFGYLFITINLNLLWNVEWADKLAPGFIHLQLVIVNQDLRKTYLEGPSLSKKHTKLIKSLTYSMAQQPLKSFGRPNEGFFI